VTIGLVLSSFAAVASLAAGTAAGAGVGSQSNQTAQAGPGANPNQISSALASTPSINVQRGPEFVTNDSGNGYVYVPNHGTANPGTVSVFKSGSTGTIVHVGNSPLLATYDPTHGLVYITNSGSGNVSVLSGTREVKNMSVGSTPWFAMYDPANGYVYVPNSGGTTVTVLNGLAWVTNLTVPTGPMTSVYDARNNFVYVSDYTSGYVSVFSGTTLVKNLQLGSGTDPLVGAYDSGNGFVYIPESSAGTVAVLNGTSFVKNISVVCGNPHSATYDSMYAWIYVPMYCGLVAVINGTTQVVLANVTVGSDPLFGAVDTWGDIPYQSGGLMGAMGLFVVANSGGSNVTVLQMKGVVDNITVGLNPHSATYNPGDGVVFVPNSGGSDNNASVLGGTSPTVSPCPSATGLSVKVQAGYKQAWVNWTDPVNSGLNTFSWSAGPLWFGTSMPTPKNVSNTSYAMSENLNALNSSTTYYVLVLVTNHANSCGTGGVTRTFSTQPAPTNGFAGWVYQQALGNSHQINPLGAPAFPAVVKVGPICWSLQDSPLQGWQLGPLSQINFTAASTNRTGYYAFSFPLTFTLAPNVYYTLYSNGTCTSAVTGTAPAIYNSHYDLIANATRNYTVERTVSSSLTAKNDFQQFALPTDFDHLVPVALMFVHTSYKGGNPRNDATCSFTWYSAKNSSTISQTISLNGQHATTEENSTASSYNANGTPGASVGLSLQYPFTGLISYNNLQTSALKNSTWVAGQEAGASTGIYNGTVDWMKTPTNLSPSSDPGAGWIFSSAGINNTGNGKFSGLGMFSSTTGYNVSVGLSVGWGGVSASVSIPLQATTTVSTTITTTAQRTYNYTSDQNSSANGQPYFWSYYGTPPSGSPLAAIIHTWLVGWCNGKGEPAC